MAQNPTFVSDEDDQDGHEEDLSEISLSDDPSTTKVTLESFTVTTQPCPIISCHDDEKPKKFPQIFAAFGANVGAFAIGMLICWSATAIPSMRRDEEFQKIDETQSSWISSMLSLGALLAAIPGGMIIDRIGRRKTLLLTSVPFSLGWVLVYFAQNAGMIIGGRFITGFCCGIVSLTSPIFIAETSDPSIRGTLISTYDSMACIGILVQIIVGTYVNWRWQSLICAVIPLVGFFILLFVPESPRYLLSKGLDVQASKSLCWLRGISKDSQLLVTEIKELNRNIDEGKQNARKNLLLELFQPHIRKAFLIGFLLFLFQSCTGMIAVMFYRIEIFESAHVDWDEYTSSIIMAVIDMLASMGSALFVDRFGRKVLLIASELLLALSLGGLGAFFYVQKMDENFARDTLGWLPLISLIVYVGGFSVGMGGVPYSVVPEILPQHVRGLVSSLLTTSRWAMSFIVGRFFKDLMGVAGQDGGYWTFAGLCVLGALYVFFFVPETKGKSLEEIQKVMKKK